MRYLQFKPFSAPKVYRFKDPDTGNLFAGKTLEQVRIQVLSYRSQNQLEAIEYLPMAIEHYTCCLPENVALCESRANLSRSVMSYLKGGIALLKNLAYNKFATQEVADERAAACIGCPFNVFDNKGPFVKWSDDIALASVGDRKSVHHDKLGNCAICSCVLRAKVFFGDKLTLPAAEVAMMPEHCWQKKEILKNG